MQEALFSVHDVNRSDASILGEQQLPDGSWIKWGLSRKEFGPMSFGKRPEWDVAFNRMQFLRLHGLKIDQVVAPILDHTANVEVVTSSDTNRGAREKRNAFQQVDALVTRDTGIVLITTHADCLPVWLCAPDNGWTGMAHVGRRGLLAGMIPALVNSIPEGERAGLTLGIGPGISRERYEVSREIADEFSNHAILKNIIFENDNRYYLDLKQGVLDEAKALGVSADDSAWQCTFETSYLSSFRRDSDTFAPMAAFITRTKD